MVRSNTRRPPRHAPSQRGAPRRCAAGVRFAFCYAARQQQRKSAWCAAPWQRRQDATLTPLFADGRQRAATHKENQDARLRARQRAQQQKIENEQHAMRRRCTTSAYGAACFSRKHDAKTPPSFTENTTGNIVAHQKAAERHPPPRYTAHHRPRSF